MKFLAVICIVLLPFSSFAAGKKTVYKKTQEVTFESTDVDGLVRSPDGAYLNQKKGVKFLPLYKVEKNFDRDIKNSVDYLR
ncbi:MAG: hypothetical protein A2Z20_11590 [Bdellovibrionales bacterium RBG_16_40_8]|nr:MAG: hypothetical protein A2Z20_11590 [Bdellovibrionales bacterium RBG_16_40_8]